MKKIAVLGAGGFVGRSLTEYFSADGNSFEVIPVTRKQVDLLDASGVCEFIKSSRPDAVINCASCGGSRKNGYNDGDDVADKNFRIYENVENALGGLPETVHIIFGSGAQYDKSRPLVKVSESEIGARIPKDAYGLGKLRIAEHVAKSGRENTFMPVIFGLFGPYEDYTYKFISNACAKVLLGMDIVINRNVKFDYLYIDDFCRIIKLLIADAFEGKKLPHRIFNITPTVPVTLECIGGIVKKISGKNPDVTILNGGMGPEYTGDNSFLLENLGGFGFLDCEESVARLYRNLEERLPGLDAESVRADAALKYCANKSSDEK